MKEILLNNIKEIKYKFGGYEHKDGVTRFHNFYTRKKYNGITEIRKQNQNEVNHCWKYINNNGKKTYYERQIKNICQMAKRIQ